MRAVRVHEFGVPPVIEEVPDPVAGEGRSVVRVEAATVGHIDRTIWGGAFLRHPPLPYTPGVEAAGVVVAGDAFPSGTRVWIRGGGLGTATDGTWSELASVPDASMGLLPDEVPFTVGSAFFSPSTSAWVSLHEVGGLRAGERVVVTGATGAVGSMACQLALEMGASVAAIVSSPDRLPLITPGAQPILLERGASASEGLVADLLIDTVGGGVLATLLPCVVGDGRVVLVGYLAGHELQLDLPSFIQRDVSLLPLNMIRREPAGRAAAPELLARLASGQLRLDVTTFALDDAAAAMEWLSAAGHQGRAVLLPQPPKGPR